MGFLLRMIGSIIVLDIRYGLTGSWPPRPTPFGLAEGSAHDQSIVWWLPGPWVEEVERYSPRLVTHNLRGVHRQGAFPGQQGTEMEDRRHFQTKNFLRLVGTIPTGISEGVRTD